MDIIASKTTYYLITTFQIDGRPYTHRDPVTQSDYDRTQIGNVVHIKYLSDHPEISRIAQSSERFEIEDRFEESAMTIGIEYVWIVLITCAKLSEWLSTRIKK